MHEDKKHCPVQEQVEKEKQGDGFLFANEKEDNR
jgi:hypothetical protein